MKRLFVLVAVVIAVVSFGPVSLCRDMIAKTDQSLKTSSDSGASPSALPGPHWLVRYSTTSSGTKEAVWGMVQFVVRAESRSNKTQIAIERTQIVKVIYSAKKVKDSDREQGPRSGCSYARSMRPNSFAKVPDELLIAAVNPGFGRRLASNLMQKYPVQLTWLDGDVQRPVSIRVMDCEYESFIANLRWMLGPRWNDISDDSSNSH